MKGKLLNDVITKQRMDLDISQKELSEATGVSINVIKQIETGRMIGDIKNLKKICNYLKIELDSIYFPNFRNTRIISLVQNKGGDGKTSACGSLAYAFTDMIGKDIKVLMIDGNPQNNLTRSFGMEPDKTMNIKTAMEKDEDLTKYIKNTAYKNIDIIVSHPSVSAIEMTLLTKIERENCLKNCIRNIVGNGLYDFIFIDTDNHLGMLNYNILNVSDYAIIPVRLAAFSLDGLDTLIQHIRLVKKTNNNLKIAGIMVNQYDLRKKSINSECEMVIKQIFADANMFETKIGLDSTIEHAQFFNVPVILHSKNSKIAKQYKELAKEVLKIVEPI
ncbi:MAG: AAA family ATPase [Bacteroidales bacterium]|nr:AAA family ATPase [Bacteroidales bacterium]